MEFVFMLLVLLLGGGFVLVWPKLRRRLVTPILFTAYRKALPKMSSTEREALEAGSVWWEGELFGGRPQWGTLLSYPVPKLTEEEQAFLDHECQHVCSLVDDWEVTHASYDLSPEAWAYIKAKGFLGMIIPKEYGGLGFSAYAHSQVVTRLSTHSSALSVSVMVPNSLGPAELLLHYGTEAQKDYYLPRLACGQDIPAFALTSPWAGSDAAAIPDYGIVCKGMYQGTEVLGMRVSWDKRYITLAPVCTIFGLAFHLYDPDHLLGEQEEVGITCALVPHDHSGVEIGRRHFPLNAMFMNGPTRGTDVFMPLDFVIGGAEMVGQGWRMLMESLAAGRSISLPSSNAGMAQMTTRTVGAYSRVRSQFKMPIGKFEGIEERLARMAATTYMMDAVRTMTAGAVDLGEKPSVISAIVKYHITESGRQVVNDGMDIIGGKGICLGPDNFLGRAYQQLPISITVEGANILTRSLIIFGQGAVRCHPYLLAEMRAAQAAQSSNEDAATKTQQQALHDFDRALFGHLAYTVGNGVRAFWLGLTGAHLSRIDADVAPSMRRHYQQLNRLSSAFAFLSDVALLRLGGGMKRSEKLSGRLGDILSQMYLASAVLKRFEGQGRQKADAPLAHWALQKAEREIYAAFDGVLANFPGRILTRVLRFWLFPLGCSHAQPSDALGREVVQLLLQPSSSRDRLARECYLPKTEDSPVGLLELAFQAALQAESIEVKIRKAEASGRFQGNPRSNVRDITELAFDTGVITAAEYAVVQERNRLRDAVIRVDDFAFDLEDAVTAHEPIENEK